MTSMTGATVKLLMVWLLVGPPALCRAGVLVECCDHESTETANSSASVSSPCCGDADANGDSERPTSDPMPRKCGTCAGVCATVVKPPDDFGSDTFVALLVLPLEVVSEAPFAPGASDHVSSLCRIPSLPYPPSDLPLLI